LGTLFGKVFGVNLKTGMIQSVFETDGYKLHHLDYFKDDVQFRDDIHFIIKTNEAYLDALDSVGAVYSTPAIRKGGLIFGSNDGNVYSIATGNSHQ